LAGISPAGDFAYVSQCYGGRISDRNIVEQSGVLDKLWQGATVLADKGFLIEELLQSHGLKLAVPPLLQKGTQFSDNDLRRTRNIAAVRIHVERAIRRAKTFRILTIIIPIPMVPNSDDIVFVCFFLSNFMGDLVRACNDDD